MTLPDTIKAIQRAVGQAADGVFGPVTAAAVWRSLTQGDDAAESPALLTMDDRSEKTLATLDPKAQPMFREFYHLANATAATFAAIGRLLDALDRTRLLNAVTSLSERQRDVVRLRAIAGLDFKAVADTLGISEENARVTFSQAKKKLTTLLRGAP